MPRTKRQLFLVFLIFLSITQIVNGQNQKYLLTTEKLGADAWQYMHTEPQPTPTLPAANTAKWKPIKIPGDVNLQLMDEGVLPNLHHDTLAREAYWVTAKDWWFSLNFDADFDRPHKTELVLEMVDGVADIWLNGKQMGTMKNAFYPHRFNVGKHLKNKDNTLIIRFKSINKMLGGKRLDELRGWHERRSYIRKPQFNFGWDWALPVPGIGLPGKVYLEHGKFEQFIEHGIQTYKEGRVDMNFEVSKPAKEKGYQIAVEISGHGTTITDTITSAKNERYKTYGYYNIKNPKLWWPNGYGDPNLYNYSLQLIIDGQIVDSKKGKFGIREAGSRELPFTQEAGKGYSFEIMVNNKPVFAKGSNWIPTEIWPAAIKPDKYRWYLEKAAEANFNMLRVWGGGIYEKELFYELCDELGIMVWQDFMFASAGYPADTLLDEITKEADYQIKRLRNHPSIVLWCGTNEDYASWTHPKNREASGQADIVDPEDLDEWKVNRKRDDEIIFALLLRGMVNKHSLGVPYVQSSPVSREDAGNWYNSGNAHLSCWKYALFQCGDDPSKWRGHFEPVCSFDSEFCIQGPANLNTIQSFLNPENHWPPNDAWIYHIQRGHQNLPHYEQHMFIAGGIFGEINSLEKYVKYGQATHLEQTRAEYEYARYDRPNNGGTMSWMYNDCWPTSNWSIIDYYHQPKPAYYAAKRACAPVLPIVFERKNIVRFAIANETLEKQKIKVTYGEQRLNGKTIWKKEKEWTTGANQTEEFFRIKRDDLKLKKDSYLFISWELNGQPQDMVTYFADGWKNVPWPTTNLKLNLVNQEKTGEKWLTTIKISTDNYARLCHLSWKNAPKVLTDEVFPKLWFGNNDFDLPANQSTLVTITSDHKLNLNEIEIADWLD